VRFCYLSQEEIAIEQARDNLRQGYLAAVPAIACAMKHIIDGPLPLWGALLTTAYAAAAIWHIRTGMIELQEALEARS
jgi:hypothetical protein